MPAYFAAFLLFPQAFNSYPSVVLFIKIKIPIAIIMAIKIPMSILEPGKIFSNPSLGVDTPLEAVGNVNALFPPAVLMNCLFSTNTQLTILAAIQFVIIQTITSLTLRKALKKPGIRPQIIPQSIPTIKESSHTQNAVSGVVGIESAVIIEPIVPIKY